jgi:hypothetical protein
MQGPPSEAGRWFVECGDSPPLLRLQCRHTVSAAPHVDGYFNSKVVYNSLLFQPSKGYKIFHEFLQAWPGS